MRATGNARGPLHAADANLGLQRVCVAAVEELKSLSHQCLLRTAHNDTMRREELQARAALHVGPIAQTLSWGKNGIGL